MNYINSDITPTELENVKIIESCDDVNDNNPGINDNYIQIIMNQTDMSYENAKNKLNEYNNDYIKVIYDYLGVKQKNIEKKSHSVNQLIYKEIRTYMNSFDRN
jgi:hypothetical protein